MSEQVIPVFYACDNSFVKYMVVSLKSLLCNASPDYRYRIHILHSDITEELQEKVRAMATEYAEICFHEERLPIRDYYSNTTYYRMFIAEMFPEYDKALYIDSDTVVPGDISELYEKELGDNYVGAAHEQAMVQENVYGCYVEEVLGIDRNNYFNAGVLLINCKAFRENRLLEKFIELLGIYNLPVVYDSLTSDEYAAHRIDFADKVLCRLFCAVLVEGVVGDYTPVNSIDDSAF